MDRINRQKGIFVTFEGPNGNVYLLFPVGSFFDKLKKEVDKIWKSKT